MSLGHRLIIMGVPLAIIIGSGVFLWRSASNLEAATTRAVKLEKAARSASGEARQRLREESDTARDDEDVERRARAFWSVATGFGVVLFALAITFQIALARHLRRSAEMIASFDADEVPTPPGKRSRHP